jgi:predicted O-linked N-acetylglucosamine transferase (SPINDLY family)
VTIDRLLRQAHAALAAGREAESLALLRRATAQEPANAEALFHLGNLLSLRRDFPGAVDAYERALLFAPGHPELLINLGITLAQSGDTSHAEARYREALQRQPTHAGALGNLGQLLFQRESFAEALQIYDRLLAAMPRAGAEIWNNRGICQQRLGDRAGAEQSFRRALSLQPDSPEIHANLGFLLYEERRYDAAGPLLSKAHALDPQRILVAAQAFDVDLQFADWREFDRRRGEILAAVARFESEPRQSVPPYLLLAICDDPALQRIAATRWAWPRSHLPGESAERPRQAGERLKIGFVATAFHEQPVSRLIVELLERFDRERFELRAYTLGRGESDALSARIERAVAAMIDLGHAPAAAMAERIRDDGIDVLFDLSGHTGHARPDLFAAKAAPVQVGYLGYPGTFGASYFDFIIGDDYVTPASAQSDFAERICSVGACYLPTDTRKKKDKAPRRVDYGIADGALLLMSQAAPYKILPDLFGAWMALLRGLPDAILWLRPTHQAAQKNLRAEAHRAGVDPRRLVFTPAEPLPRYLARYALADLYLDTAPYGSHTTVNDALSMGLPVVTITGRSMAARASASQLHAVGLPELVAASTDEYEAIAAELARERDRLRALSARLRDESDATPLFDMQRYTREFEAALDRMWAEKPAP